MRQLTWKNVFLTLLGASFISVAGFYATGISGFAAAGAIAIVLLLLAAWVWAIQSLIVSGGWWAGVGYVAAFLTLGFVGVGIALLIRHFSSTTSEESDDA
jgi:hypothetical protein